MEEGVPLSCLGLAGTARVRPGKDDSMSKVDEALLLMSGRRGLLWHWMRLTAARCSSMWARAAEKKSSVLDRVSGRASSGLLSSSALSASSSSF